MTTMLGLDLRGRRVVVVGGGPVAARRIDTLVQDGAEVVVVAPHACEPLVELAELGALTWQAREARADDLDGAWLAVTATGSADTDLAVLRWAQERRVFCLDAGSPGRPSAGSARAAATARSGDLVVGVVGAGDADPRRSMAVRDAVADGLATGLFDLRRRRAPRPGQGRVVLVGGGPGDPDLLTVAGRRALAEADVVVADRLGPSGILTDLPADVQVIDVGKQSGHHLVTQEEIHELLIEHARRGLVVIRLKGGDPYLYGRGGEEVLACRAAGVPVTVLPGVSSALAVPGAAGIPLTHRGTVDAVHVMNGHGGWSAAALTGLREVTCTVVVMMGVSSLGRLVAEALAAGVDPATPAAVVENGTLPGQRVTRAALADLPAVAAERRVQAPAVVVLGRVASEGLLAGVAA